MQIVTIETDAAGANELAAAVQHTPGVEFDLRELQAQVGDPDTWIFVAQIAPVALTSLTATVMTLLRQRKIKYIKVGDREFRDITASQLSTVVAALDGTGNA